MAACLRQCFEKELVFDCVFRWNLCGSSQRYLIRQVKFEEKNLLNNILFFNLTFFLWYHFFLLLKNWQKTNCVFVYSIVFASEYTQRDSCKYRRYEYGRATAHLRRLALLFGRLVQCLFNRSGTW